MTMPISRREFVGGLLVSFAAGKAFAGKLSDASLRQAKAGDPSEAAEGLRPNVFVHVAAGGLVTIACHRSEMGQGVRSTLPALLADELGADPARIQIVQADGDKKYGDQNTDGSSSIRGHYQEL